MKTLGWLPNYVAWTGANVTRRFSHICYDVGLSAWAFVEALRPGHWNRAIREVLVRQIYYSGYKALGFILVLSVLVGMSIVVQALWWLTLAGQRELVGRTIALLLVREVAPVIVNMVVIGRSGMTIVAELGMMKVTGQVHVLESEGIDPFRYLVMPRVLGLTISVLALAVFFVVISLVSGYLVAWLSGAAIRGPGAFMQSVIAATNAREVVGTILKCALPGAMTGAICCSRGLSVGESASEIPRALPGSFAACMLSLFVISVLVSLVLYG